MPKVRELQADSSEKVQAVYRFLIIPTSVGICLSGRGGFFEPYFSTEMARSMSGACFCGILKGGIT